MIVLERIVFNIIFNTTLSFLAGITIVVVAIHLLRIKNPALQLYLYSLPFAKVLFDIFRGVPPNSYIWTDLNFFSLPANLSRWLSLGVGFSSFGPIVALRLGIGNKFKTDLSESNLYSVSIPDVVYSWTRDQLGPSLVTMIIFAVLLVGSLLLANRIISWVKFELSRIRDRSELGQPIEMRKLAIRNVDIYISPTFDGSPFTGGFFRPYICFPKETFLNLSEAERAAVIGHEIGHIKSYDLLQSMIISLMGDIFWFIPFYRMHSRKIEILREMLADRYATRDNVSQAALVQSLIKLKEFKLSPPQPALYSAFSRRKSILERRIDFILSRQNKSRSNPLKICGTLACGLVITGTVISATFGGNYQIEQPSDLQQKIENWIKGQLGLN